MDLDQLNLYIEAMKKYDLVELEIEEDGRRIHLRKSEPNKTVIQAYPAFPGFPAVAPGTQVGESAESQEDDGLIPIKSPMVGTFYRASSPEADPFVDIGSEVQPDTIICILEAMKVMNEVHAEVSGVIRKVLVENGQPVQYGEVLFLAEPA